MNGREQNAGWAYLLISIAAFVVSCWIACSITGCAAAKQGVANYATTQPLNNLEELNTTAANQNGAGNIVAPVDVSGWTGFSLTKNEALPAGVAALMLAILGFVSLSLKRVNKTQSQIIRELFQMIDGLYKLITLIVQLSSDREVERIKSKK